MSPGSPAKVIGSSNVPMPLACWWRTGWSIFALNGGSLSGKPYIVTRASMVVSAMPVTSQEKAASQAAPQKPWQTWPYREAGLTVYGSWLGFSGAASGVGGLRSANDPRLTVLTRDARMEPFCHG